MDFGEILKEKRKEMGITQKELAEKLNVSRSAISNWEIGRNYPDIQTIISISNLLDVSLDYLLNEDMKMYEVVNLDLSRKKRIRKIAFILAALLVVSTGIIIFLVSQLPPEIRFVKEEISNETEMVPFSKEEFKVVRVEKDHLVVVVDLSGNMAGYSVMGGGKEITLNLYKIENDPEAGGSVPYNGLIEVDLSVYSDLEKINIAYN